MPDAAPPEPMPLEDIVTAFLELVADAPDKPPRRVRDQESNRWTRHGFNLAQETLREILQNHGATPEVKALAAIRRDGQQQPIEVGDRQFWMP